MVQNYLSARDEAERYKNEMIPRASKAYQLYLTKYEQMGAAYPQVIVCQRTLFQLQARYVSVLQNVWTAAIALQNYALSGGLNPAVPMGPATKILDLPNASIGTQ
jgi:cobalt-zinc-cadmium efflux system outer membrane protein